ncbi:hypothetical protein JCM15831A_11270 [Asaia astilbis]
MNNHRAITALSLGLSLISGSALAQSNQYVTQSQVNQPNGIAGLNGSGNLTAPMDTSGNLYVRGSTQLGSLQSGQPAIMQGVPAIVDGALAPTSILIGGVGNNDFAPTKITSPLIGPSDFGGCVLSVNDSPFEQFSRCGTGYDESIGIMEKVSNRAPRLTLGEEASDAPTPSGTRYSVTFAGDGFAVRPALAPKDKALLVAHSRVYSNYYNGMISTQATGSTDSPALWYGYIWNWADGADADGSYTTIRVSTNPYTNSAGWTHNTSQFSALNTKVAPGKNAGDRLDTYISRYSHAAALIGQVGKKFVVNSMIQLDATVPNSPTLAAEGEELDLQLLDKAWWAHDKRFSVHGKTIVLTGMDHAADDSYLERLAGTNLLKKGMLIDGIMYGGQPLSMSDGGFHFYSNGDLNGVPLGYSQVLQQLGSMNFAGNFSTLLLYGSHDRKAAAGDRQGWGEEGSLHLGLQEKSDANALNGQDVGCNGCTSGGQIVWNPVGHHYGIGIGAGVGTKINYGLLVEANGATSAPNGLTSEKTLTAKADVVVSGQIKSSQGVSAVSYSEKLTTPASSSAPCKAGQFTDDAHNHYVCVADNHWRRVALQDF